MFRDVIDGLSFINWPLEVQFSDEIPANFQTLKDLCNPLRNFFCSDSGVTFLLSAGCAFLVLCLPAWLIYYKNKKKTHNSVLIPEMITRRGSTADSLVELTLTPIDNNVSDAEYAEEVQFQEAILASIFASEIANTASSSLQGGSLLNTAPLEVENKVGKSSLSFCGICLEDKERWEMFENDSCSHSFCYECTGKHIISRIKEKVKIVGCPALHCKSILDYDTCRLIIPKDSLIQWDESLCQSLIPESQRVYCPFRDCSAMFVNDTHELIKKVKCIVCRRSFCAHCRVPWHPEFTCKEFQKSYAKQGQKEDILMKTLAKKKSWQKCPKCKMYVEKIEGCIHITCRCKYEFCYRCGSKWTGSHSDCRPKP